MIGDLLAQSVAHAPAAALAPPPPVDAARVLRLGLYGLCVDGPLGAAWYDWLEANVSPDSPRSTRAVLLKTALDQVRTFGGSFWPAVFMGSQQAVCIADAAAGPSLLSRTPAVAALHPPRPAPQALTSGRPEPPS